MATSLATGLKCALAWHSTKELGLGSVKDAHQLICEDSLANGAGLDQAEELWHDRRTLDPAEAEVLDLAGGLTNAFGDSVAFARIKGLWLANRASAADAVLLVGGGADGSGDQAWASWLGAAGNQVRVGPAGLLLVWNPAAAGFVVGAGTTDRLRIANLSSSSLDYDIVLLGTRT